MSKFTAARQELDATYHTKPYDLVVHDSILKGCLSNVTVSARPIIHFTCGAYGAGKSRWITKHIAKTDVWVDPDDIRHQLPNIQALIKDNPWSAGELTNREVGYLSETLIRYALSQNYTIYADGSMCDYAWYTLFLQEIQTRYPQYMVRVYYFEVPWVTLLERVWQRAESTKRCIPLSRLRQAYEQAHQAKDVYRALLQEHFIVVKE